MARRLASEWENGEAGNSAGGRASNGAMKVDTEAIAIDLLEEKPSISSESESKPVHPKFTPQDEQPLVSIKDKTVPEAGPSRPRNPFGSKAAPREAAPPIDFDVDSYLFHPEAVDVSLWPKGRLPYSVLVGVYVQVASTRSRLLIVRLLTK